MTRRVNGTRIAPVYRRIGQGDVGQNPGSEAVTHEQERLRRLVEAGISLTSELSLASVLQRLVDTAAALTAARYAALGVIGEAGRELERFVTHGVDEQTARTIGRLPVGRGILGVLIDDARPLRLQDLTQDPRSVGFPLGHPQMSTFLGVPILLRGVAYGNLYLTEKRDNESFTDEDEEIATLLAAQAAVAIENARLYESATRWMRQLESMAEIGNVLVGDLELPHMLERICTRLRELVGARSVFAALPTLQGDLRIEAAADEHDISQAAGLRVPLVGSKSGQAFVRRQTYRVDSFLDDPDIDHELARRFSELAGLPVPTAGVFVPLVVRDRAIGVLVVHDRLGGTTAGSHRFNEEDERLVESFASRAAVAIDLSQRVELDVLRRVVAAQEVERRRLARELHDETGQALTSLLLGLRAAEEATEEEARRKTLASLRELATATLQDVRRLAVELRPKSLDDFGLVPALERLVSGFSERTGLDTHVQAHLERRLPPEVETALYRIVQEALTNVAKHARATSVSVLVTSKDGSATAVIEDDGVGFSLDTPVDGLGLMGMRERVNLLGGRLTVESSRRTGTTIVVEVPVP
jgi:signal transduction histidine kinase